MVPQIDPLPDITAGPKTRPLSGVKSNREVIDHSRQHHNQSDPYRTVENMQHKRSSLTPVSIKDYASRKSSIRNVRQQTNEDIMAEVSPAKVHLPIVDPFMHTQDVSKKFQMNAILVEDTNPDQESSLVKARKPPSVMSSPLLPKSQKQANIVIKTSQPRKRKNHVNKFKQTNMQDRDVIEFLTAFVSQKVNLTNSCTPTDFDSTDNLDSFLMALLCVN